MCKAWGVSMPDLLDDMAMAYFRATGQCGVLCVGCGKSVGMLSVDPAGHPHVSATHGGAQAAGRERIELPCPRCRVTRASNTPKSLLRAIRADQRPIAH